MGQERRLTCAGSGENEGRLIRRGFDCGYLIRVKGELSAGWILRSLHALKSGTFVCAFSGMHINQKVASLGLEAILFLCFGCSEQATVSSVPTGSKFAGDSTASAGDLRRELDPLLIELQSKVRLNFADDFPYALRDDLKEELALSLEALVTEAYAGR